MKHIINLLNLVLVFATIFYTAYYVDVGDICRTVFGCTAIIVWTLTFNMEK